MIIDIVEFFYHLIFFLFVCFSFAFFFLASYEITYTFFNFLFLIIYSFSSIYVYFLVVFILQYIHLTYLHLLMLSILSVQVKDRKLSHLHVPYPPIYNCFNYFLHMFISEGFIIFASIIKHNLGKPRGEGEYIAFLLCSFFLTAFPIFLLLSFLSV